MSQLVVILCDEAVGWCNGFSSSARQSVCGWVYCPGNQLQYAVITTIKSGRWLGNNNNETSIKNCNIHRGFYKMTPPHMMKQI